MPIWHRAAHDHAPAQSERLQNAGHRQTKLRARHADKLEGGPGGIEQRAEIIENGFPPALAAPASRRGDLFECRMIIRREEKGEIMFPQRLRGPLQRQVDLDAQRLQHVGAAGLGGDGAVAMFGHRHSRSRGHQRHGGGDIERIHPVSAGAANVQNLPGAGLLVHGRFNGQEAQFPGESANFLRRLALPRKGVEESGLDLDAGRDAGQFSDGVVNLLGSQRFAAVKLLGQDVEHAESVGTEGGVC